MPATYDRTITERTSAARLAKRGLIFQDGILDPSSVGPLIRVLLSEFDVTLTDVELARHLAQRGKNANLEPFWANPAIAASWVYHAVQTLPIRGSAPRPKNVLDFALLEAAWNFLPFGTNTVPELRFGVRLKDLERTSRKYRLGLVSEFRKDVFRHLFSWATMGTSADDLFTIEVYREDCPSRKPMSGALYEAVDRMGFIPRGSDPQQDSTIFVVSEDVAGAAAAMALRAQLPKIACINYVLLSPCDKMHELEAECRRHGADQIFFSPEDLFDSILESTGVGEHDEPEEPEEPDKV